MNGANSGSDPQSHGDAGVTIDTCGLTDIGRARESNQDQFLVGTRRLSVCSTSTSLPHDPPLTFFGEAESEILIVADGMGGHAAGERASQLAVQFLARRLADPTRPTLNADSWDGIEQARWMQTLLRNTHSMILRQAQQNPEQFGMGTTLTMAEIIWPYLSVLHAGDSRCYLVRDGNTQRLTTDHTLARRMVDAGDLTPEEESASRWSNVLWNVLGGQLEGDLVAQVERVELLVGDTVVVCSDGLHRYVNDDALALMVSEGDDAQSICQELIRVANEGGGEDNITVIVSRMLPRQRQSTGATTLVDETLMGETFDSIEIDDGTLATLSQFDTTVDESAEEER
ncbi:PP2C family protein-serine/threonine phosphatase [Novipirellula rosea]|uniref:Protein phosphatase 2C domain-containing protein n=1 Tax=Novipirellula rosea TaxID=1031540 RepID=A0ABP8NGL8_9BACT|tara:strand:+ start:4400 stop:5425 length:1026 start_codon:yes stop_codon:yes gene_type:complete